ncbi:MAG: nitrogenase component 1 [Kiritimatiellales bacterium]
MKPLLKETSMPPKPSSCCTPTTNACKLCTPLGACLAFRGFEGCVPFLHGSQGCATYIRRYLISHFREPMDIASSSFSEETVVFGGKKNLHEGLFNVIRQYRPEMIGIATTCLAETIGDDLHLYLHEFNAEYGALDGMPALVPVSTPSYAGTHAEGFWCSLRAVVDTLAERTEKDDELFGICPGMVSPADIRHLHEILKAFHLRYVLFPDYADTLDGGSWEDYLRLPPGGTPISSMRRLGNAGGLISFAACMPEPALPGPVLRKKFGTQLFDMPLPVGVEATDRFLKLLSDLAGLSVPAAFKAERARLIDAYVDGHKITAGKRVAVFGDADFVVPMTAFLREAGMIPVLCASGGKSAHFAEALRRHVEALPEETVIRDGVDFSDIEDIVMDVKPDLLVGSSKGYTMSRRLNIPLLRVGFPVHDRIGGPRILHVGYRGAQQLFDSICNLILDHEQNTSPVGYAYM